MNKDLEYECRAIGKIAHEVISIEYKDNSKILMLTLRKTV
jgi:hypothetical protein